MIELILGIFALLFLAWLALVAVVVVIKILGGALDELGAEATFWRAKMADPRATKATVDVTQRTESVQKRG